jgi:hypothetical protein
VAAARGSGLKGKQFEQVALNPDQVAALGLPSTPLIRKRSDVSRAADFTSRSAVPFARKPRSGARPLVLFTLADCDPAGRQMPVSIGRKLQALRDPKFPRLR